MQDRLGFQRVCSKWPTLTIATDGSDEQDETHFWMNNNTSILYLPRHIAGSVWLRIRQGAHRMRRDVETIVAAHRALRSLHLDPRSRRAVFVVPSFGYGGVATVNANVAAMLAERDFQLTAIATEHGDGRTDPRYDEAFTNCVNLTDRPDAAEMLLRLVREIGPELYFVCNSRTGYSIMPRLKEPGHDVTVIDRLPAVDAGGGSPLYSLDYVEYIDRRVIGNEFLKAQVLRDYENRGIPAEYADRLNVIVNGVDLEAIEREGHDGPDAPNEPEGEHAFQVGYLGRMSEIKDVYAILDIANLVQQAEPDVRFSVAGDGPLLEGFRARKEEMGLNGTVRTLGFCTEPLRFLSEMDALILTSRSEGLANSVLEAMALGRPVVCTRVGALPEIVQHGKNGYLVERGDGMAGTFARHIVELAEDAGIRRRLADEARKRVRERFDMETVLESYAEVFGLR